MVVSREEGRQFDVIFGDLTDIPVHGNDTSTWNFVRWTFPQCILPIFSLDGKTFYLSIVTALNGLSIMLGHNFSLVDKTFHNAHSQHLNFS